VTIIIAAKRGDPGFYHLVGDIAGAAHFGESGISRMG